MTANHGAERDHRQSEPTWRFDPFGRSGVDSHHQRRHSGVIRDRRAFGESGQGSRRRLVEHERINHAKLDTQQNQKDSCEKVAVTVHRHESLISFIAIGEERQYHGSSEGHERFRADVRLESAHARMFLDAIRKATCRRLWRNAARKNDVSPQSNRSLRINCDACAAVRSVPKMPAVPILAPPIKRHIERVQ